jgi:hypothetical protein
MPSAAFTLIWPDKVTVESDSSPRLTPRFTAASHGVDDRTMPAEIDRCQRKSGFREI